jgi:hypothetical protein
MLKYIQNQNQPPVSIESTVAAWLGGKVCLVSKESENLKNTKQNKKGNYNNQCCGAASFLGGSGSGSGCKFWSGSGSGGSGSGSGSGSYPTVQQGKIFKTN